MSTPSSLADRVRAVVERRLTGDEVRAALDRPISNEERDEVLTLVRWFRRRYPNAADRLAYARRAYGRWRRR